MSLTPRLTDVLFDVEPPVCVVTINRPAVRNACRHQTICEIGVAVRDAGRDPAIRAVIVTGAGDQAFSAGADLKELATKNPAERDRELAEGWGETLRAIELLGKPVIAAVRGWAVGGGTELALACHVRIAGVSARFGQPEILRGHIPGGGGTVRLPRLVGEGRALLYLLTGDTIAAAEAERIGLVSKVVPDDAVMDEARALGRRFAALSPLAVQLTLEAVIGGRDDSLEAGLMRERSLCARMRHAGDYWEGLHAFADKRVPRYGEGEPR